MLTIREAIVVEGRYDKNTLSQVVDTLILETNGFGIFKDPERMSLLRRAAERRGLIVLTDSDGAGATVLDAQAPERARPGLTKADLMAAGLTGGADSARRRQALLKEMALPEHTSANALLQVLNGCYSREEALDLLGRRDFDGM